MCHGFYEDESVMVKDLKVFVAALTVPFMSLFDKKRHKSFLMVFTVKLFCPDLFDFRPDMPP